MVTLYQLNIPFIYSINPKRIRFNAGLLAPDDLTAIKNTAAAQGFVYDDMASITSPN